MSIRIIALLTLLVTVRGGDAIAQPGPNEQALQIVEALLKNLEGNTTQIGEALKKTSAAMVDLSVPDSPAFTVLGLAPEEISRPTTARRLAASLLNGVDRNGVLQSGIAIDTVPYLAAFGPGLTLEQYRDTPADAATGRRGTNNYLTRFMARTQLSLATAKASSDDDKAVRAALGVRLTLLDFGDPRTDAGLEECFDKQLPQLPKVPRAIAIAPPPGETAEQREQRLAAVLAAQKLRAADVEAFNTRHVAAAAACREAAKKAMWNDSKWLVAIAPAARSSSGAFGDLTRDGYGVWTTLAYGFDTIPGLDNRAQVLLHGRIRDNEQVVDPADSAKHILTDSVMGGVQIRAGGADSSLAFEALWDRKTPAGGTEKTDRRVSVAYERRLAPNLWLGVAIGDGTEKPDGSTAGSFLLSSLKWGFAEGPSLAPAP